MDYTFEYPEKLAPVLSYTGRYIVLKGGRSSGKSHFLARKFLIDRLRVKRDLLCVREYQKNLEQSNYKLFKSVIQKYKLPYKIYADKFVSLQTGSEIIFEGMNNLTADNIKSYEGFADAWVEEGQKFSISSFELLAPTIREPDSKIYVSMNPKEVDGDVLEHIQLTYPDNSLIIHINYNENPFCPDDMILEAENVKKRNIKKYNETWLGIPSRDNENYVVPEFTECNFLDFHYCDDLDIYLTCDFNVDPMCWALFHKDDKNFYFFDEIIEENTITKKCIEYFYSKYKNHKANIYLMGDASGNRRSTESEHSNFTIMENYLNRNGFTDRVDRKLKYNNPLIKNRISAFNNMVCDLNNERHIFVNSKSCPKIVNTLKNIKYREGTRDIEKCTPSLLTKFREKGIKYWEHLFDAISYPAEYFNPVVME